MLCPRQGSIQNVLIVGASKFLGQHLIQELLENMPDLKRIHILDDEDYVKLLDYHCNPNITIKMFHGRVLEDANLIQQSLEDIQAVFHLYEYKSYALFPDVNKFRSTNVEGTKFILEQCAKSDTVKMFIFGSAFEIMVDRYWHCVHHPEVARIPYGRWAFPEYSISKLDAEELVFAQDQFQSVAVRMLPMFGELDTGSWIIDQIRKAEKTNGVLAVLGDGDNAMQHIYVGNAAYGLVKILETLTISPEITKECTFLVDNSTVKDIYKLAEPFLSARNIVLSKRRGSFPAFYIPYIFMEKFLRLVNKFVNIEDSFTAWRSSAYFFTYFNNWIFFKNLRCRLLFNYSPRYTFEDSVGRCSSHYANVAC